MEKSFNKLLRGYQAFRSKYVEHESSIMKILSREGQKPEILVVSCCDSRVDPALILQCSPGDLFVVRNVANIVPPYECDKAHHGTSTALEFGICYLNVKHVILLGHSNCGGIASLFNKQALHQDDFISSWVSIIKPNNLEQLTINECAKLGLEKSYTNCLTFPWIKEKIEKNQLKIHMWYFDIEHGEIYTKNDPSENKFNLLNIDSTNER
jgi:carbonic anhydrase